MRKFSSIKEWIASNPTTEEMQKILLLVNRGETSRARKEIWEKEQYVRKLQSFANHCKKLGFNVPEEEKTALAKTKKEIEELKKGLPPVQKRAKKETELAAQE